MTRSIVAALLQVCGVVVVLVAAGQLFGVWAALAVAGVVAVSVGLYLERN